MIRRPECHRQNGQAMTEFVVMTAGFLLILFVLVPVVAKLSDMSYKAQEAARYTAWERTVWYQTNGVEGETMPSQMNLEDGYLATRNDEDILNTAERRILSFSRDPQPFDAQDIDPQTATRANNFWRWTHGEGGQPMTGPGDMAESSAIANQATPSTAYSIVDGYNTVMGVVADVLNVISFGQGDQDFMQIAHPTRNFYTTSVNIPVPIAGGSQLGNQPLFGDRFNELNVGARSAVLADGWVAQTEDGEGSHFDEKVDDFVLGTLIDENPIFETVQSIIGIFEPSFKTLDLAPVDTAPINDSKPRCNVTTGFCYFDE
ncbi:hypothetical protein WG219_20150 [Ectopseudomonas mendocina]|uniref:Flp pilus-assembly TadG-like N-terminal domain-containing protein n=1 Tax=Ectopseudomonas mendocina TaxID=300 RepID=A0ABZ2RLP0_ECTME